MSQARDSAARTESLVTLGLALASGALYFVGFAGFDQWYLAPFALVPFLEVVRRAPTPRRAFWFGFAMGLTTHLGGYYWIPGTIHDFGGFPWTLALLFDVCLCSWGALSFALLAWILKRWWLGGGRPFPSAPVALVAVEFAYPLLFPSFLANSFWNVPVLIQVCDLGGPLLLSAIVACFSTAVWLLLRWRIAGEPFPRAAAVAAAVATVATIVYGLVRLETVPAGDLPQQALKVGVVQVNMGTFQKGEDPNEGHRRHILDSLPLQAAGAELIVWPESALISYLPSRPGEDLGPYSLRRPDVAGAVTTPVLFGALRRSEKDGRDRSYNSAFLVDGAGRLLGTYDKTYLLAFGEYLPFGETFPVLYEWSPHSGRFTPGDRLDSLPFRHHRIGALVCYEDVLPRFVRKMMVEEEPHLLVNITNDAWFGDTNEPEIHLALSVFRAVEHRRWLVRATNSGISAVVDPTGRVVAQTERRTRETLLETVHWRDGATLYGLTGDWIGWLAWAGVGYGMWRLWKTGNLRWRRAPADAPGKPLKKRRRD